MLNTSQLLAPWSDWAVVIHDMPHLEVIVQHARLVILSPRLAPSLSAAVAHATAHLELGHHEIVGGIPREAEQWAEHLAFFLADASSATPDVVTMGI